ncbi:MAG: class I SAM-dependent methyltransferase [Ktedonobacteraceae bacterium]
MQHDKTQGRQRVRELAQRMLPSGDIAGFFDAVYATAGRDANGVPWADLQPHPVFLSWLQQHNIQGQGRSALVVGCGLGDDAEELAGRGFQVTAFDISPNAIAWCQQRFPNSSVMYQAADLFATPAEWRQAFDFVLEIYTIQALSVKLRTRAIASVAQCVAPGGQLLIVCRGRDPQDKLGTMPWPLTRVELAQFEQSGLHEVSFEDIRDEDRRHFRVVYSR